LPNYYYIRKRYQHFINKYRQLCHTEDCQIPTQRVLKQ
jgi:hypothetical protein